MYPRWSRSGSTDGQLDEVRNRVDDLHTRLEELEGSGGRPEVTDAAATIINEHGLDVRAIAGTGEGGRITKDDAEDRLEAVEEPQEDDET